MLIYPLIYPSPSVASLPDAGKRPLMLASLRYLDRFVKIDGAWPFAERLHYVDWLEDRALS